MDNNMKAEIDNENKAKFFAQYWGQKIVFDSILIGQELEYVSEAFEYRDQVFEKLQLEIKSLSSISDEDAIEVSKLQDWELPISKEDRRGIRDQVIVSVKHMWVNFLTIDFLRDRGYLVPWMGLSCEELIEAGWAKYKE